MTFRRRAWVKTALKRRVVVHMLSDMSIRGVLMAQTSDGFILRASTLLAEGEDAGTSLAGEVFIPREQLAFVQLDD